MSAPAPLLLALDGNSLLHRAYHAATMDGLLDAAGRPVWALKGLIGYLARAAALLRPDAVGALKERLLPLAEVLTPNIPEAELLAGMDIRSPGDMETAARRIGEAYGCAVLCKGGHDLNDANDLLWKDGGVRWFRGVRIDNPNTHGTGCTLSSAIASNLAKGMDLETAVERAKAYISGALGAMLDLGRGRGPMNHLFDLKSVYIGEGD